MFFLKLLSTIKFSLLGQNPRAIQFFFSVVARYLIVWSKLNWLQVKFKFNEESMLFWLKNPFRLKIFQNATECRIYLFRFTFSIFIWTWLDPVDHKMFSSFFSEAVITFFCAPNDLTFQTPPSHWLHPQPSDQSLERGENPHPGERCVADLKLHWPRNPLHR